MEFPRAALCSLYVVFCSCFVDAILSLVSPRILTMMFYRVFLTLCFLFFLFLSFMVEAVLKGFVFLSCQIIFKSKA